MKKIFLLGILVFILTGCTSIQNSKLDVIINNTLNSKVQTKNVNRKGYRYYLPKGLSISKSLSFNEILKDQKYYYYLYVDVISYNNKTLFSYHKNESSYYSHNIVYNNNIGYIEINKYKNNQYLIEIMYNYAKIEVVVYEADINMAVTYAMVVLTSITYNDFVINNYLDSSVIIDNMGEENFDIFEIIGSDNYLEFRDDDEIHNEIKDPDYIN